MATHVEHLPDNSVASAMLMADPGACPQDVLAWLDLHGYRSSSVGVGNQSAEEWAKTHNMASATALAVHDASACFTEAGVRLLAGIKGPTGRHIVVDFPDAKPGCNDGHLPPTTAQAMWQLVPYMRPPNLLAVHVALCISHNSTAMLAQVPRIVQMCDELDIDWIPWAPFWLQAFKARGHLLDGRGPACDLSWVRRAIGKDVRKFALQLFQLWGGACRCTWATDIVNALESTEEGVALAQWVIGHLQMDCPLDLANRERIFSVAYNDKGPCDADFSGPPGVTRWGDVRVLLPWPEKCAKMGAEYLDDFETRAVLAKFCGIGMRSDKLSEREYRGAENIAARFFARGPDVRTYSTLEALYRRWPIWVESWKVLFCPKDYDQLKMRMPIFGAIDVVAAAERAK